LARRHRGLVRALVVQATALEWRARLGDRLSWMWLPVLGAILRSWAYPRYLHRAIERVIPPGHELVPYLGWITAEMRRGDPKNLIEAGRALKFYDARDWARGLGLPAAMLITTRDRLVRVSKQRALAMALGAQVTEIDADHLCTMAVPDRYAAAIVSVIDGLVKTLDQSSSASTSTRVSL
jgi:3-oxoadipate enol-lactonase